MSEMIIWLFPTIWNWPDSRDFFSLFRMFELTICLFLLPGIVRIWGIIARNNAIYSAYDFLNLFLLMWDIFYFQLIKLRLVMHSYSQLIKWCLLTYRLLDGHRTDANSRDWGSHWCGDWPCPCPHLLGPGGGYQPSGCLPTQHWGTCRHSPPAAHKPTHRSQGCCHLVD